MALWLQDNQRALVSKFRDGRENIQHHSNYSTANLSTSRKNSKDDGKKYLYSGWGFVRFVGKAHEYLLENVKDGDLILIKKAQITKEAYEKAGETVYPKYESIVVFDLELARSSGSKESESESSVADDVDEDDVPF